MKSRATDEPMSEAAEIKQYRVMIKRLPLTIRPSLSGQLAQWETLFPFERRNLQEFMDGVASFGPSQLDGLLDPMRKLEARMGVEQWDFSEAADTMENASMLARSAFYAEWRDEVRRIYAAVETAAHAAAKPEAPTTRVIVAILPKDLPFEPKTLWKKWGSSGVAISIDGDAARIAELLLKGPSSVPSLLTQQGSRDISDLWLIDAGSTLQGFSGVQSVASSLSWVSLGVLRERVLAQINTVPKSIEATDETLAAARNKNWDPWWPTEVSGLAPIRRFVIDLYLSGNGALIFSNAFVEWAASEAIRRARPRVVFARFGLRAKPKAFTGIAIFENQQRINKIPDVDDPPGSAVDASVLARYILLAAQRYPEGAQTAFLCVAESAQSAYLHVPEAAKAGLTIAGTASPEQIAQWMMRHLSQEGAERG
jgi:hypothetical protein